VAALQEHIKTSIQSRPVSESSSPAASSPVSTPQEDAAPNNAQIQAVVAPTTKAKEEPAPSKLKKLRNRRGEKIDEEAAPADTEINVSIVPLVVALTKSSPAKARTSLPRRFSGAREEFPIQSEPEASTAIAAEKSPSSLVLS
jgi:hypothetical protein